MVKVEQFNLKQIIAVIARDSARFQAAVLAALLKRAIDAILGGQSMMFAARTFRLKSHEARASLDGLPRIRVPTPYRVRTRALTRNCVENVGKHFHSLRHEAKRIVSVSAPGPFREEH